MGKYEKKLVFGVGINDSDTPIYSSSRSISHVGSNAKFVLCPIYRTWRAMLERCYSERWHSKFPTYIDCYVITEWHRFSCFKSWMISQNWEGKELDKDILYHGNKEYSPDKCVFVPGALNGFILDCKASRGRWPIGVSMNKSAGRFQANCQNPFTGEREYLGLHWFSSQAHEAWRKRKHELACQYADMQTDMRIADALRNRYAKKNID